MYYVQVTNAGVNWVLWEGDPRRCKVTKGAVRKGMSTGGTVTRACDSYPRNSFIQLSSILVGEGSCWALSSESAWSGFSGVAGRVADIVLLAIGTGSSSLSSMNSGEWTVAPRADSQRYGTHEFAQQDIYLWSLRS